MAVNQVADLKIEEALIKAATEHKIAVSNLELLRVGNNYVYADRATETVYRVSVRDRDTGELLRENQVLANLAAAGAPILGPSQAEPLLLSTGHTATVWPLGGTPESDPAESLAPVLASLHATPPVDGMCTWAGFERGHYRINVARSGGVPVAMVDEVDQRLQDLERIFPGWSKETVVHGDPHTGNLVRRNGTHLLIDLDDLALGCPEIDLAPLYTSYRRFDGIPGTWTDYLAAYGQPIDTDLLDWFSQLRLLTMIAWLFTLWDLRPESQAELTHRINTLDKAAKWNAL